MILSEVEIIGFDKGACPSGGADVRVPSTRGATNTFVDTGYFDGVPGRMAGALFCYSNGLLTVYH